MTNYSWICGPCGQAIATGKGCIAVSYNDIRAAEIGARFDESGEPQGHTLSELLAFPDMRAQWSSYHYACAPVPATGIYYLDVDEVADSDALIDTMLHMGHKRWLGVTNWYEFVSATVKDLTVV